MNKKEKILDVLASNYNINLFSEMGRIRIAELIIDALDNKSMPEFGDDVITEEKAKLMKKQEENKSKKRKSKIEVKPPKVGVSRIRSKKKIK